MKTEVKAVLHTFNGHMCSKARTTTVAAGSVMHHHFHHLILQYFLSDERWLCVDSLSIHQHNMKRPTMNM